MNAHDTPANRAPVKSTSEIRRDFLEFFASKGHTIVPSAPLVPGNDPTLLFTNSGMVQFKDVFLGAEKRRQLLADGRHRPLWPLLGNLLRPRLTPLPAPCVDTGMGLERIAAILQHVHSNYEIDLFQRLIRHAAELTGTADLENKSLRVIADHIRACAFLIVDGVLPSNEGRGYVLRRIIRRALRHGWMLGVRQPFFHKLVATLDELMGEAYPVLREGRATAERALKAEEERFAETLDAGMRIFDDVAAKSGDTIPGVDAFRLYDTYGFPLDLTADMARERDMDVDVAGFDAAMARQKETARAAGKFGGGVQLAADLVAKLSPTACLGYDELQAGSLEILALLKDGKPVEAVEAGDDAIVILDRTPFYAESGGQVGDIGELDGVESRFEVADTAKLAGQFHGHAGRVQFGRLRVGERLRGEVDAGRRGATILNHSATHLLHGALREVLGTHVQQKGSLVAPDRLRFDFSHFQPMTAAEVAEIERRVNAEVRANHEGEVHHMGMQEALDFGAMALFGEKYGEQVRVLRFGPTSTELCGGTHVGRTGDIGLFKIISEGGVSAGVRRIEAVTGQGALDHVAAEEHRLDEAARLLGGTSGDVGDKLRALLERQKKLERELQALKAKAASSATGDLGAQAREVGGIKVLAARLEGFDAKALREAMDRLKQQLGDAVIVLAGADAGKAALVAGVGGAAAGKVKAGELLGHVAGQINGKGGGRPDMAQGGGDDGPALLAALDGVQDWVAQRLPA